MSKKEEILHKLSTEDRNYIKKKFKEGEEFCIGQVESLTNLINVLIEVNKELNDEKFDLEAKLAELREQITILEEENGKTFMNFFNICRQDTELKLQLTEADKLMQEYLSKCLSLEKQLAEKEDAVKYLQGIKRYDIGEMIAQNIKLKQLQNKTVIEELKKVKKYWLKHEDIGYYIDQQIKSLKGEK